ncbi:cytochrome P450 [Peniophora sp. CONT]|nr:cytochrome P450 [Peniophora sp. CONT]
MISARELFVVWLAVVLAVVGPALRRRIARGRALRNIPAPPSDSWLTGHIMKWFREDGLSYQAAAFDRFGRVFKLHGFFYDPQLVISDPTALTHILVKEADNFELPSWFITGNWAVFGPSVVTTTGAHHRNQRKLLTPVFSEKNLRRMHPQLQLAAIQLKEFLAERAEAGCDSVNMLDAFLRLTLECIGKAGFGYNFNNFTGEIDHPYLGALKDFAPTYANVLPSGALGIGIGTHHLPLWVLNGGLRLFSLLRPSLADILENVATINRELTRIWEEKNRLFAKGDEATVKQLQQDTDLLSVCWRASRSLNPENRIPEEEALAHIRVTMFAGADTSAAALSRAAQMLAEHQDVQDALREEIINAGATALTDPGSLPLLDAVVKETLRLFPPAQVSQRAPRADAILPLQHPITGADGARIDSLHVPAGTHILINVRGANCDPTVWGPDAHLWKPSRWLSDLPQTVTDAHGPGVYAHLMTFLGGSRSCIGFRFSQLVMKTTLATIIPSFHFAPTGQEVTWRYFGVLSPGVKGSSSPDLPLRVTLLRGDAA